MCTPTCGDVMSKGRSGIAAQRVRVQSELVTCLNDHLSSLLGSLQVAKSSRVAGASE